MEIIQNGVRVLFLPDNAYCDASAGKRSPFDLDDCPLVVRDRVFFVAECCCNFLRIMLK